MNMNNSSLENESKKFTIKRMLKAIFKKKKQIIANKQEENMEIAENNANDKIYEIEYQDDVQQHDLIPVHFITTEHGTFFWTTDNPVEPDADLIQPLYCSTSSQIAVYQC